MKRVAAVVVALIALLGWASPALAHASLESSEPAAAAVLAGSPSAITLRFSEAVGLPEDAIRLFDEHGVGVPLGRATHAGSSSVTVALPTLADGLYVVTWRAVSADSHPVSGAFTFTVGSSAVVNPGSLVSGVLAGQRADRFVVWAAGVVRAVLVMLVACAIGLLSFPLLTGAARTRRWQVWCAGVLQGLAVAGVAALLLGVVASSGRSISGIGSGSAWSAYLQTSAGWAAVVRAAATVLAAVVAALTVRVSVRRRVVDGLTAVPAAVAVAASAWAGHGATGRWAVLSVPVTVVHTVAMGVWFGGLVALVAAYRSDEREERSLQRFSTAAFVSVALLVGTGVLQGIRQLGAENPLLSWSTYSSNSFGRLLAIKVMVVAAMVAVAGLSRRSVRRNAGLGLGRLVAGEVLLGLGVLAVTSALMVANPSADRSASVTVTAEDDAVAVSLFVEPARAGTNTMHLTLRSPDFGSDVHDDVSVRATLARREIGPLDLALEPAGTNHFTTTAASLPYPGTWTVTVAVQVSEFDRRVFTLKVRIRP